MNLVVDVFREYRQSQKTTLGETVYENSIENRLELQQ